jgi:hypothetical protein
MREFQLALRFITSKQTIREFVSPHGALDAFFAELGEENGDSPGFRKSIFRTALDVMESH